MDTYIWTHMNICICIYIYIYTHTHTHTYPHIVRAVTAEECYDVRCMSLFVDAFRHIHVCLYLWMHYIFICVHMYDVHKYDERCMSLFVDAFRHICTHWSQELPPPGKVFYLAGSLIKNPEEEDHPRSTWYKFFEGGPRPPGLWLGNLQNRRPPRGGRFPAINIHMDARECIYICIHTYIYVYIHIHAQRDGSKDCGVRWSECMSLFIDAFGYTLT